MNPHFHGSSSSQAGDVVSHGVVGNTVVVAGGVGLVVVDNVEVGESVVGTGHAAVFGGFTSKVPQGLSQ